MNRYAVLSLGILTVKTFQTEEGMLAEVDKLKSREIPYLILSYNDQTHFWEIGESLALPSWTPQQTWIGGEGGDV